MKSLNTNLQNKINIKIGLKYPHLIKEAAFHGMDRKMMNLSSKENERWALQETGARAPS